MSSFKPKVSREPPHRPSFTEAEPTSETVARFTIRYTQYLDRDGRLTRELPASAGDPARLLPLYRTMVLTRLFDTKAVALQRTGKLGTYAPSLGQEALGAGIGAAMRSADVLLPTYREYAAQLWRGVRMAELLLYWGGDERGMCYSGPREDFPLSVPVASHAPHAVGVAYAFKLRRESRVAVCVLGDGATSKGDFYEALNAAGVWQLPVVFVIANNRWAISVPRTLQSAAQTLAQKAIAAGIPGEQVDGNDVIAVHQRMSAAVAKARAGGGPTLIEALTYRLGDHTTADDASRYRSAEELERHWREEPLARLRTFLTDTGHWSEKQQERLDQECSAAVEEEVRTYLDTAPQPPESMFDHLYEHLPHDLAWQREEVARRGRHE
jgi:2-oxoisovalerate dehydrogenase E1 component alpha subunit